MQSNKYVLVMTYPVSQAHAYVEYLQAQVYTEKQGRHELESYFVAERGRLDQIHKSSKQIKNTLNEILSLVDSLRFVLVNICWHIKELISWHVTNTRHLEVILTGLARTRLFDWFFVDECVELMPDFIHMPEHSSAHVPASDTQICADPHSEIHSLSPRFCLSLQICFVLLTLLQVRCRGCFFRMI